MRALQGFEFFGKQLKIVYAKGTSDVIAKLRGAYNVSTVAAPAGGASTDLQKSIFSGPPGSTTLPSRPTGETNGEATSQGVKRPREEESDEGEAPMDEESDVPMEDSSDED
ncbi:unnamed protein product [Aspergillus oryzae]|nr:unnamed protein product [Aspergillus oryzae]GMF93865.1 unnamed protein product [Aspergillus oryzae]GMG13774.1 unnamed protein product [Aspergillus oryzae]GMG33842.1 unnamed protein product [Aspergillus oryzae]GMG50047.1 unnamed protein product [Aspergillus oryzae var. brunneus]